MICPKCNKEIDYGLSNCPHCFANLSFSTRVRDELNYEQLEVLKIN